MPPIYKLEYEFINYDEAVAAIKAYALAEPGNPFISYPYFEIDRIQIDSIHEVIIWLRLKPND